MSELLGKITNALNEARKAGDKQRVSILSVARGECDSLKFVKGRTNDVSDEEVVRVLKKLIKDNEELACAPIPINKDAIGELANKKALLDECKILSEFLPVMASKEQIWQILGIQDLRAQIRDAKNEGAAKGIAMKAIKAAGLKAESTDVIAIAMEIYTEGK